jgi:hypothetical protein
MMTSEKAQSTIVFFFFFFFFFFSPPSTKYFLKKTRPALNLCQPERPAGPRAPPSPRRGATSRAVRRAAAAAQTAGTSGTSRKRAAGSSPRRRTISKKKYFCQTMSQKQVVKTMHPISPIATAHTRARLDEATHMPTITTSSATPQRCRHSRAVLFAIFYG